MAKPRLLAVAGLMALAVSAFAQDAPTSASIMKEAQAKAAKEKKSVWVIFHASW